MPALHDSDVTVQPTAARGSSRFDKVHGALCALRVSQQFRYENCPQMIEKELSYSILTLQIWWRFMCVETIHEAILQSSSEAQNSFWIKSRTGEDMGQFSAGPKYQASISTRSTSLKFWTFILTCIWPILVTWTTFEAWSGPHIGGSDQVLARWRNQ